MNKKISRSKDILIILVIFMVFLRTDITVTQEKNSRNFPLTTAVALRVNMDHKDPPVTGPVTVNLGDTVNITVIALDKDNNTATDAENDGSTLRAIISTIRGKVDAGLPSGTADGDADLDTPGIQEGQYAVFPDTQLNAGTTRTDELTTQGAVPVVNGLAAVNVAYPNTGRTGDDTITVTLQAIFTPREDEKVVQTIEERSFKVKVAPTLDATKAPSSEKLASISFELVAFSLPVNGEISARVMGLSATGKPVDTSGDLFITIPAGLRVFQEDRFTEVFTGSAIGTSLASGNGSGDNDGARGQRVLTIRVGDISGSFPVRIANADGSIFAELAEFTVINSRPFMEIFPRLATIEVGQTVKLTVKGTVVTTTSNIEWTSSNPSVAIVSPTLGDKTTVTGKAKGTTFITATEKTTRAVARVAITVTDTLVTTTTVPPIITAINIPSNGLFGNSHEGTGKTLESPDVQLEASWFEPNVLTLSGSFIAGAQPVFIFFGLRVKTKDIHKTFWAPGWTEERNALIGTPIPITQTLAGFDIPLLAGEPGTSSVGVFGPAINFKAFHELGILIPEGTYTFTIELANERGHLVISNDLLIIVTKAITK